MFITPVLWFYTYNTRNNSKIATRPRYANGWRITVFKFSGAARRGSLR
jgi:hypothetical protein